MAGDRRIDRHDNTVETLWHLAPARFQHRGRPEHVLGGIDEHTVGEVVAAGADGVAVITAITMADDPEAATRDLAAAMQGVHA